MITIPSTSSASMQKGIFTFCIWACLTLSLLTGCIAIGTGSRSVQPEPTLGQELQDLKAARDAGAMTPDEYEHHRKKLLETHTH